MVKIVPASLRAWRHEHRIACRAKAARERHRGRQARGRQARGRQQAWLREYVPPTGEGGSDAEPFSSDSADETLRSAAADDDHANDELSTAGGADSTEHTEHTAARQHEHTAAAADDGGDVRAPRFAQQWRPDAVADQSSSTDSWCTASAGSSASSQLHRQRQQQRGAMPVGAQPSNLERIRRAHQTSVDALLSSLDSQNFELKAGAPQPLSRLPVQEEEDRWTPRPRPTAIAAALPNPFEAEGGAEVLGGVRALRTGMSAATAGRWGGLAVETPAVLPAKYDGPARPARSPPPGRRPPTWVDDQMRAEEERAAEQAVSARPPPASSPRRVRFETGGHSACCYFCYFC